VITAIGVALQAQFHASRRPVQRAGQVGTLDQHLRDEVAYPRIAPPLCLQLADQGTGLG
jgi:hypothetical protein